MNAVHDCCARSPLKHAVWGSDPELLTLWHGGSVPVWPGDRVRYYEPVDGQLIFVGIDDDRSKEEDDDGDA